MFKRNKRNVIIQKMFQNKTEDILKWNNTEDIKKTIIQKKLCNGLF